MATLKDWRAPDCPNASWYTCWPVIGRRSAGGQKKRRCDVLASDLKWCDLWHNWRKIAKDKGAWRCLVREETSDFMITRKHMRRRGRMRRSREEWRALDQHWTGSVKERGGVFVGWTKAGLVSYVRQRHGSMDIVRRTLTGR